MTDPSGTGDPAAPAHAGLGRWQRGLPMFAALIGVVLFGGLAVLSRIVADENEERLLVQQTDQAGAALTISIGQVRSPLEGAARAAAATGGDPIVFERMVTPLM